MGNRSGIWNACFAVIEKNGIMEGIRFLFPWKRIYDNDKEIVIWKKFSPASENGVFAWECKWEE